LGAWPQRHRLLEVQPIFGGVMTAANRRRRAAQRRSVTFKPQVRPQSLVHVPSLFRDAPYEQDADTGWIARARNKTFFFRVRVATLTCQAEISCSCLALEIGANTAIFSLGRWALSPIPRSSARYWRLSKSSNLWPRGWRVHEARNKIARANVANLLLAQALDISVLM
jgi:hypothetical protein